CERKDRCTPERARADAQPTAGALRERLHFRIREAALRIDQLRMAEQRIAEAAQYHAARLALEQRQPVMRFEAADALRERRLADAKLLRGSAHASGLGHGQEVAKQRCIAQE